MHSYVNVAAKKSKRKKPTQKDLKNRDISIKQLNDIIIINHRVMQNKNLTDNKHS